MLEKDPQDVQVNMNLIKWTATLAERQVSDNTWLILRIYLEIHWNQLFEKAFGESRLNLIKF